MVIPTIDNNNGEYTMKKWIKNWFTCNRFNIEWRPWLTIGNGSIDDWLWMIIDLNDDWLGD